MSRLAKILTSVITLLAVVGVGLVIFLQTQNDEDTYEVTAYFEKAIGLFENSDVTILGVPVGKITAVDPVGNRVRVDMEIDGEYKIPADTHAEIVPISVIADRYVEFDVWRGGPTLQDGAVLQVAETEIPAELDDVFLQLKKLLDALKPDGPGELGSLGELIVALDRALEGREQDLKGAIVNGAKLTHTLARSRDDISDLLINLDELFGKLAPRAESIATLNRNFAIVMRFLSESRADLEGTLEGLGDITVELADLVRRNGSRVTSLLHKAARVTPVVLRNQKSIEQSLAWLGVVGEGLANAYHGGKFKATDVRSNRPQSDLCEDFEAFPLDPDDFPEPLQSIIRDLLEQLEDELCVSPSDGGGPPAVTEEGSGSTVEGPAPDDLLPDLQIDCRKGIRQAKRQIRRIEEIGIPDDVKSGILVPLEENLEELARKCRKIGELIDNPEEWEELLEELPPELRELLDPDGSGTPADDATEAVEDLTGNASGTSPVSDEDEDEDSWVDGVMRFLGVAS